MEPNPLGPGAESPAPPPPQPMSLPSRLVNVFAAPSEVFDDIKHKPVNNANWAVPGLIIVLVGWLASLLIFSDERIKQQMSDISQKAVQKQFEKKNLPKEQMDTAMAAAAKYGSIGTMVTAFFLPVLSGFVLPLVWGLFFWVIGGKLLGGNFPYLKGVEAVGLANMVTVLDIVVKSLLIISMGSVYASPSLMLLVKDWNPENSLHGLLAYANIMTFWVLAVRAVGISRLSNVSFGRATAWVFVVWFTYSALFFGIGIAAKQVFGKMGGG